jgi:hypothetical protein
MSNNANTARTAGFENRTKEKIMATAVIDRIEVYYGSGSGSLC